MTRGLDEALHTKERCSEWSAPHAGSRMAALEMLLHQELDRHCQLYRSRLDTYQKLREKVVLYAEARGYQVAKAREDRDDPMDVGGFGQSKGRLTSKGKGKNPTGKGKGTGKDGAKSSGHPNTQKIQGQCWNCAKTGHQSKDCWAKPQQHQSHGQSNSSGKGNDVKGKSGKGGGKKGKSKDAGALVWNQQAGSPVAVSVASSAPQTETSTTVGTVDTIACTALDLCATSLTQQIVNPRWIASDVVHKPLLRAGDVTDKGHALWLDGDTGYIIQKDSPILTAMRTCFMRVCEQHPWNGAIDLTKERGVYNLHVQVAGGDGSGTGCVERAVDVNPNEMEVDEVGSRTSGGFRQVKP